MNSIAIIGATGFIGKHLLETLTKEKNNIRVLSHSTLNKNYLETIGVNYILGDMHDKLVLNKLVNEMDVLVILKHISSSDSDVIETIVSICNKNNIKKIIYISSAVVAGKTNDKIITEKTVCNPVTTYEKDKYNVEKILSKSCKENIQLIIVRPTAVFGEGGKNLVKMAQSMLHGNPVVNYIKSSFNKDRKMNLVCVENVVSAIIFLIKLKKYIKNEVFIISDDENKNNNYRDIEKYLMNLYSNKNLKIPRITIPRIAFKLILFLKYKRYVSLDRIYSCQKLNNYGFVKSMEFTSALKAFASNQKNL